LNESGLRKKGESFSADWIFLCLKRSGGRAPSWIHNNQPKEVREKKMPIFQDGITVADSNEN